MATVVVHPCGNSAVEMVYRYCKPRGNKVGISYKKSSKDSKYPYVTLQNGVVVQGLLTTIKVLVRFSENGENPECSLLGQSALEEAEVEQWLEHCVTQIAPCLQETAETKGMLKLLNSYILSRVYFVGQHLTIADLLIFSTLQDIFCNLTFQEKEKYIHVSRWFHQVQNDVSMSDQSARVTFLRNLIY